MRKMSSFFQRRLFFDVAVAKGFCDKQLFSVACDKNNSAGDLLFAYHFIKELIDTTKPVDGHSIFRLACQPGMTDLLQDWQQAREKSDG
ncbi:MAG: hypothetical protein WDN75_15285 [Bacteroidota bacterium]